MSKNTQRAFTQPDAAPSREAELDRREAELKIKELQLNEKTKKAGSKKPDWPPFLPLIRHNIERDIPEKHQLLVKRLYGNWLFGCVCYTTNLIAAIANVTTHTDFSAQTAGIATAIFLIGIPGSFMFWYRSLYKGVKHSRSISLIFFFINFSIHTFVSLFLSFGIPLSGSAGFTQTVALGNTPYKGAAALSAISAILCVAQFVYCLWNIRGVFVLYLQLQLSDPEIQREVLGGITIDKTAQTARR